MQRMQMFFIFKSKENVYFSKFQEQPMQVVKVNLES